MVKHLEWKTIAAVCLIVGVFETISMLIGYMLTRISFFSESQSEDLKQFCYFVAAVLFLTPKEGYYVIALILGISLFVYGFRLLWFYFVMSRYMVGGKAT